MPESILQVFFVGDKAMPGWSVVLKKESRSRRMNCTEEEHALGQEGSREDLQVFADSGSQRRAAGDSNASVEAAVQQRNGRRRNWNEAR